MRVVCDIYTPHADSYGNPFTSRFVYPHHEDTKKIKETIMEDVLGPMGRFSPGMKIEINFEEDWNEG